MALSKDEREQFLAQPHIAALSVYAGDARGPLMQPQHWLSADLGAL